MSDELAAANQRIEELETTISTLRRLGACTRCTKLEKQITELEGEAKFHKGERRRWRTLWEEQRGGDTFNAMQRRCVDLEAELRRRDHEDAQA